MGLVIEHAVVPGVRNADAVHGEEARGARVQLPGAGLDVVLRVVLDVDVHRRRKLQDVATHNDVQQQSAIGIQAPGNVRHSQDFSSCKFHLGLPFEHCVSQGEAIHGPS